MDDRADRPPQCLRGLLRELGTFIAVGARQVIPAVWALIEDADSGLPDALQPILAEACHEIRVGYSAPRSARMTARGSADATRNSARADPSGVRRPSLRWPSKSHTTTNSKKAMTQTPAVGSQRERRGRPLAASGDGSALGLSGSDPHTSGRREVRWAGRARALTARPPRRPRAAVLLRIAPG